MKQEEVIEILLDCAKAEPDCPVKGVWSGSHLVCVESCRPGVASVLPDCGPPKMRAGGSALEIAELLRRQFDAAATAGLAAVNSLLPVPRTRIAKGQDVISRRAEGKRVAVIGHFPFVEKMGGNFASFDVLELRPGPGDLPADRAREILPRTDFVILTSTTLMNGTFAGLMNMIPESAYVLMLGPSTPFCAELFDLGVDGLAGIAVTDKGAAVESVETGVSFKKMRGVEFIYWEKDHGDA